MCGSSPLRTWLCLLFLVAVVYEESRSAAFVPLVKTAPSFDATVSRFAWSPKRHVGEESLESTGPPSFPPLSVRKKQQRRPIRRPIRRRGYWAETSNIEFELLSFWENDCNVTLSVKAPPPIPNESLLGHFERHDLRWGIASQGGREAVSYRIGGAMIIPGKWDDAIKFCPDIMEALLSDSNLKGVGLSRKHPPVPPQQRKEMDNTDDVKAAKTEIRSKQKWLHQDGRKPKGYWNEDVVTKELYQYLNDFKSREERPSVWMPRPSEIASEGRDDLKCAISRFGGSGKICEKAGLISYNEWQFFESQLNLFILLQDYLWHFQEGSEDFFPPASDILSNGYNDLYHNIQQFGGRKLLASRLGMRLSVEGKKPSSVAIETSFINFGPFSLDFAIRLSFFIRSDMLHMSPPLNILAIKMPSVEKLKRAGEEELAMKVVEFGGCESIARRLGLAFFVEEP